MDEKKKGKKKKKKCERLRGF
jgi:hypothetical protein